MGTIVRQTSVYYGSVTKRFCCFLAAQRRPQRCSLLVVGGGTGGCSVAWRFTKVIKPHDIMVLEPSEFHYYQPMFTLVAAGVKKLKHSKKPVSSVLPPGVVWMRDYAENFDPCKNMVYTRSGNTICYDYLVIAVGLFNDYDQIEGLKEALHNPSSGVCTIYSSEYCVKTWCALSRMRGGHAIFTFTNRAGKCSGAAQKIMYLADDYFRMNKLRKDVSVTYVTGGEAIYGVPKYAESLASVARGKSIAVNCGSELLAVSPTEALFDVAGGKTIVLPYNFLHVTPPMSPPYCISNCTPLAANTGFLDVDKYTLQHRTFATVYGIGDCINTPNSKTAAAVAQQSCVLAQNLRNTMNGREPDAKYDGYGACPILTSYRTGILTEFVYDKQPMETFPFDQSKESRLVYYLKRDFFPRLYWNKIIRGKWDGPGKLRKIINPFGR